MSATIAQTAAASRAPIRGRVWKLGDNVDTDQLIPSQYLVLGKPREMARHCLETTRPDFAAAVEPGDIVVAGKNFGCGSSREQAVVVLKELGIAAVIAEGFSRIFFRNAINNALPVISSDACATIEEGAVLDVDLEAGELHTGDRTIGFPPFAGMPKAILDAGGLIPYLKARA